VTNDDKRPYPYCGTTCSAGWCDAGVGVVRCGPFHRACGASEVGPYDKEREPRHTRSGPAGMRYCAEFTDDPLWHDKEHVAAKWYEGQHK